MRFRYEPLARIIIRRDRLLHNLAAFQARAPGVAVAPVLKSNGYGHGLVPVAQIFAGAPRPAPFFCIDSYAEALVLRNEGIRTPLLTIGYAPLENIMRCALKDVAFGVMSIEELRRLAAAARGARRRPIAIHLKIDTGMHRQGILPEELGEALAVIARANAGGRPTIALQGAYSHLADADAADAGAAPAGTRVSPLTKTQIARWNAAAREIKERAAREGMPPVRYFHLANTAASGRAGEMDANVMRVGIGLYGTSADPSHTQAADALGLLPALELRARVTSVRKIAAGESVGYNATFVAKRAMTVATISVGYAEGVDRRLSNKGFVQVCGVPRPIVGLVSMNITSVDVSRAPAPKLDDEAVVVSAERGAPNSMENIARLCDANPCELFVHLSDRVRRVVEP